MEAKKDKKLIEKEAEIENLGLDADHSSDTAYHHYNNDNERITGNTGGEKDTNNENGAVGHSPLMDK